MSQQFGSPSIETVVGETGADGADGQDGVDGKSAYEIAVINGFAGTQTEWLLSLKGDDGEKGDNGANGQDGADGLDGDQGQKGDDGNTIIDQRTRQAIKVWTGTQVQYDAVTPKDANTLYVIKP